MTSIKTNIQPIEFDINKENYDLLIQGNSAELLHSIKEYKHQFPKTVEVFASVLQANIKKHPLLEDWLIAPHFQFFWGRNETALHWLETLYAEAKQILSCSVFSQWLDETVSQTNCESTHALCDRIYDYHLQLYGGIYLARQGLSPEPINPKRRNDPSPDYCAGTPIRTHVLDAKFVHTHEKYASFLQRFDRAVGFHGKSRPPLIFCDQFNFPPSKKVKTLTADHCLRIKTFTKKVYESPNQPLIGYVDGENYVYNPSLPSCPITIDSQREFSDAQGLEFAISYLPRILKKAVSQMDSPEYANARKILFLGLQPGFPYLAPWTENSLEISKNNFKVIASKKNIDAVFSEDVGFSVRGYI